MPARAEDRWILDRPNSYIGRSVPRPNAPRLAEGRGAFVDDIELGRRAGHAAFVRSPHAHARIRSIDSAAAKAAPGVIAVVTAPELAEIHDPWVGVLTHLEGLKSAPQYALPLDTATWQGEAVAAVVAESRAKAEDAAELVAIDWEVLPAVTDAATALDAGTPVIHESLGDNLAWRRNANFGDVEAAYAQADHVIEETYVFARHTGVCVEPRAILADFNPAEKQLTVWHNTQCPHMIQNILATHYRLEEHRVRVIARDVGGSFGIKVHTYADEIATAGLSILLKRPVKFVADRMESFVSDIHARDHTVKGTIAVKNDGSILAFEIDALSGIGPYSMYPRTSGIEANQIVNLMGGPYVFDHYRAQATVVFQNKNMMCQYRAVGHPIKCAVTEGLVDAAARATGLDPAEFRQRNLRADGSYPCRSAQGLPFENLSHHESLAKLLEAMDYEALKAERDALREAGDPPRHRPRELHRGDQPVGHVLRGGGRPHLCPGWGDDAARREGERVRRDGGDRAGAGDGGGHLAGCGDRRRGAARAAQDRHRRHRPHALRGRHVGLAGGRDRRGGGGPGGPGVAPADPPRGGDPCSRKTRRTSTSVAGWWWTRLPVHGADRARRDRAHLLLPPRHPAGRLPVRARRDPALRPAQVPLRVHQRGAGLVPRGGRRDRLHHPHRPLVHRGLRDGDQSAPGGRADPGRHRPGVGRRPLGTVRLRPRRVRC